MSVVIARTVGVPVVDTAAALGQTAERSCHKGLAFRRWGCGPLLILLHGGVGSWTHWIRNIEALAAHHTVLAPDLPGFGESAVVPENLSPDGYLDWVADALTEAVTNLVTGVAACDAGIVGFSYGGVVAAAVAARIGPVARKLSLIGPGGFGEPVGRSIAMRKRPKDKEDMHALREVTAFNLGQWMLSEPPRADDPVVDLHLANLAMARYDSRIIGWRPSLLSDLRRMRCSVQVIWGALDRLAHPSIEARRALCHEARPDLETTVLDSCGHWAQYACAVPVNDLLLGFHASRESD